MMIHYGAAPLGLSLSEYARETWKNDGLAVV